MTKEIKKNEYFVLIVIFQNAAITVHYSMTHDLAWVSEETALRNFRPLDLSSNLSIFVKTFQSTQLYEMTPINDNAAPE